MKITKIQLKPKASMYDISVDEAESYVLGNGVISHNTGGIYSSNSILVVGKQQDKDSEGLKGFRFVYNAEKSRKVVEKSKFIVEVSFEDGVSRFSGLLDLALDSGHVVKPQVGWFSRRLTNPKTGEVIQEPKKWRRDDTNSEEFWTPVLKDETFHQAVEAKYMVSTGDLVNTSHMDMESDDDYSDILLSEAE